MIEGKNMLKLSEILALGCKNTQVNCPRNHLLLTEVLGFPVAQNHDFISETLPTACLGMTSLVS